jgi:DNA-binding transcriptional LysR family regulator
LSRVDDLGVFIEVAEQGSFAAAARRLRRSPAAVTRRIADLEARLGVRLLNRTTRSVSITEVGQRLLSGAKRVLADLDEIERAAAGEGSAPRGELRITAPILFGRLHVLPIVTEFLANFSNVSVALTLLDRPVDLVEEDLDVAIRIGALAEGSAIATRVGAVHRVVVAAPAYVTERGMPRLPDDLADHAVIAFAGISAIDRWLFSGDANETKAAIRPRLVVTTAEAAIDAARSGAGITRVLCYQAADDLARGSLLRLLADHEGDELPIHVLYPGGRHLPPKLRAFLDFGIPRLRRRCEAIERVAGCKAGPPRGIALR